MKKNQSFGYAILGVLFVLVSVIAFVVPTSKTGTFWIAYVFTVLTFAVQFFIWKTTCGKEETLKSKFLGLPLLYISIVYLVIQIVVMLLFTVASSVPTWISSVICILILGLSAICMISGEVGRSEIQHVDDHIANKTSFIRKLQTEIELMADAETNVKVNTALKQLAEKVRYSDPVSSNELCEVEGQVLDAVKRLEKARDRESGIEEIAILLDERNSKCKTLK